MAAANDDLARLQDDGKAVVMGVSHCHRMPLPVGQILGCGCSDKVGGMAAHHRQFTVHVERIMAAASRSGTTCTKGHTFPAVWAHVLTTSIDISNVVVKIFLML